jgi:hypothetical protein
MNFNLLGDINVLLKIFMGAYERPEIYIYIYIYIIK